MRTGGKENRRIGEEEDRRRSMDKEVHERVKEELAKLDLSTHADEQKTKRGTRTKQHVLQPEK